MKSNRSRLLASALCTLGAFSLLAPTAFSKETDAPYDQKKRTCFYSSAVNSFNPIDDQHLMVRVNKSKNYLLTLSYPCHNLRQTHQIHFGSRGDLICNYTRSRISTGKDMCTISTVRKVDSYEEAKTLAKIHKAKLAKNRNRDRDETTTE